MIDGPPTVLLLHRLPDGAAHIDWLIARDRAGREPLIAFRLPCRLDEAAAGDVVAAERIVDHRPHYLTYEGPIAGDRGTVRRLRRGTVMEAEEDPRGRRMRVSWGGGTSRREQRLAVTPVEESAWRITVIAAIDNPQEV
jgi:hypothetical protein